MDGADASTTFTDESGKTWTASGSAQIKTAQSVFGGASGNVNTGLEITHYVSTPDHADFALAAQDFTIDLRFRPVSGTIWPLVSQRDAATNIAFNFIYLTTDVAFYYTTDGSTFLNGSWAWTPSMNTWYHIALVRNGANLDLYIDGVKQGSTYNIGAASIYNSTRPLSVLGDTVNGVARENYMDEVRLSVGIARWTANFTPPTTPYILDPDHAMPTGAVASSGIAFDLSWDMAFPAGVVSLNGPTPAYAWLWSMSVGVITLAGQAFIRWVSHLHRIFFGLSPTSDIITGAEPTGTIKAAAAPTEDIEFPKE